MALVLITGATGFIGCRLLSRLEQDKFQVRALYRQQPAVNTIGSFVGWLPIDLSEPDADYARAVKDCQAVIHLAGQVHDPSTEAGNHDMVNHQLTARLAKAASAAGVKRFIFLSSIKVNGEGMELGNLSQLQAYKESSPPAPQDAY